MLRLITYALAFLVVTSLGNAAELIKEDISDFPEVVAVLESREPLYPSGGVRTADGLDVDLAYYETPTKRYGHNIFASKFEFETLGVKAGDRTFNVMLESDVFEDGAPLIADLDNDDRAEIITTQSSQTEGAKIAIYGLRNGKLTLISQTPAIGTRNRWMNVAGIADFNGDGLTEIALVDRPHIRGELEFWTFDGSLTLKRRVSALGFSNHFIGSNAQRLSATIPTKNGPMLALPSTDRRSLLLVDAKGSEVKTIDRFELPARIAENFAILQQGGKTIIGLLLNDKSMHVVSVQH